MIQFKINGETYNVEKRELNTNSNYNLSITLYRGSKDFVCGWIERHTVSDIELLKQAVNTVSRPTNLIIK